MGYAKGEITTYLFEPWLVNLLNSRIKLENVYFVFSIKKLCIFVCLFVFVNHSVIR